jgi:hypothetical protein
MQRKQLLYSASVVTKHVRLLHAALLSGVRKEKHVPLTAEPLALGKFDLKLTLSNTIFLPTAYSPALICFGW